MPAHEPHFDPDAEPVIPDDLRRRLSALYAPAGLTMPRERDDAILREARARAAGIRRRRLIIRAGSWGSLAAAAGLAMAVVVWGPVRPAPAPQAPGPVAPQLVASKDINGDGVIDILDALALARALQSSAEINPAWDYTSDGTVNHRDIDAVAAAAVRLEERG